MRQRSWDLLWINLFHAVTSFSDIDLYYFTLGLTKLIDLVNLQYLFMSYVHFMSVGTVSLVYNCLVYVYLSLCLFVFMSVCLNVYMSVFLFVFMSICLYVYLSSCLFVFMSICFNVCLSLCIFVFMSICLFCLFVCLSNFVYLNFCILGLSGNILFPSPPQLFACFLRTTAA